MRAVRSPDAGPQGRDTGSTAPGFRSRSVREQKQGAEPEKGHEAHHVGDRGEQHAAGQCGIDPEAPQQQGDAEAGQGCEHQVDPMMRPSW